MGEAIVTMVTVLVIVGIASFGAVRQSLDELSHERRAKLVQIASIAAAVVTSPT